MNKNTDGWGQSSIERHRRDLEHNNNNTNIYVNVKNWAWRIEREELSMKKFWVNVWPRRTQSRSWLSAKSYTRNRSFPRTQHPLSLMRFRCLIPDISTISFRNSSRMNTCFGVATLLGINSCFTATRVLFGRTPCSNSKSPSNHLFKNQSKHFLLTFSYVIQESDGKSLHHLLHNLIFHISKDLWSNTTNSLVLAWSPTSLDPCRTSAHSN
jgi:hypothetical protein